MLQKQGAQALGRKGEDHPMSPSMTVRSSKRGFLKGIYPNWKEGCFGDSRKHRGITSPRNLKIYLVP